MHLSPGSPKLPFMITKVLIIGAGAIAHLHAKAALKLNPVPKIAAADPNAASRESFFTAFPGSLMFDSAETMLAEPNEGTEVVIARRRKAAVHFPSNAQKQRRFPVIQC